MLRKGKWFSVQRISTTENFLADQLSRGFEPIFDMPVKKVPGDLIKFIVGEIKTILAQSHFAFLISLSNQIQDES